MLADKAYSSKGNRAYPRRRGIRATIPEKKDQAANRYDKLAVRYEATVTIAADRLDTLLGTWATAATTRPRTRRRIAVDGRTLRGTRDGDTKTSEIPIPSSKTCVADGPAQTETFHAITSLPTRQASSALLTDLARGHWTVRTDCTGSAT